MKRIARRAMVVLSFTALMGNPAAVAHSNAMRRALSTLGTVARIERHACDEEEGGPNF
ncbi:MAG TPA: hypothetical protein VKT22_17065 [Steroidobacteraceae bacterium]|nr:hypothetical protein [Steroidobacteraceae bacterium]